MTYKKFDINDLQYFKSVFPTERLFFGDQIVEEYSHDELGDISSYPDIVVNVLSTNEVSLIMTYAYQNNIPVVVRGSGTGLVGGSVAIHGGIMIVTTAMNKIIELDEKNLTITVECGVLLLDLNKYLDEHKYFYPPDPGEKSATIGGNISTNAGGMRAVKYGVTRDFVRGLTVVTPNGSIVELGGKTVKNSSGYDIKDLIIGSEGTLAIVTQATLKLLPLPTVTMSLLIPFNTLSDAIESVPSIIASKIIPTAIEFMERQTILFAEQFLGKKFPDTSSPAYILLTFDGNSRNEVENDCMTVSKLCLDQLKAVDAYKVDTDERKDMVWNARGTFLEAIKASTTDMDECDVVVPRDKIADFIIFTYQLSEKYGVRMPSFGHAGDGNLHIYLCRDNIEKELFKQKMSDIFDELYDKANKFNGKVSGEHGIGYAKRKYLIRSLGYDHSLMLGIKAVFDDKNILNPDKVI